MESNRAGFPDKSEGKGGERPQGAGERLPFGEKMTVGMGGMAVFFGTYAVKGMAYPVYQMLLGVNPAWLGMTLTLPRLWDAFINPWVGNVSDNWRSRFGRRRPFILAGAVTAAIVYGFIWMVPPHWSDRSKLEWLLGTSLLFYTCHAVFSVPYQSLTFEMSPDYDERTSVMAHFSFWYKIGSSAFDWIFPLSQMAFFASPLIGVWTSNWIAAAVMMAIFGSLPAFFGRERFSKQAAHQATAPFWTSLRTALSTRPLLILIVLTMLGLAASMVASGMDTYLLVYYVSNGNIAAGTHWKAILTTGYALVGFASIPLINRIAHRFGKRETIMGVYAVNVLAGIGKWLIFRPGIGWLLMLDPILSSPNLTAINMLGPSMVADVCDEDELCYGMRREGMFGSVFLWIQKTGTALSFLATGLVLKFSGFDSKLGGAQSHHAFTGMRLALAGATALASFVAIFVAYFYPISRKRAAETRRQLEARRGAV